MALKPKVAASQRNGTVKAPRSIQLNGTSSAANLEQLKRDAARAPSRVIRLKDKESVTIRFLQEPMGEGAWIKYLEHGVKRGDFWTRVPCHKDDGLDRRPENRAVARWLSNVVDVGTGEVRLLYMTKNMVESFTLKYERSSGKNQDREPTLRNRNWTIVRIGGDQDTKYEIDGEEIGQLEIDGKKRALKNFELIDINEELVQMVENFYGTQQGGTKVKTSRLDEDEEEDEDEDEIVDEADEDEEEEDPDEDEDEAEDEDEDEDDAEEDAEEDEDEEEEPARPARRVQRKPLPTARKPVAPARRR